MGCPPRLPRRAGRDVAGNLWTFWKWERSASHSWRIERDILFALTRKYVAKEPDVVTALLQRALAVALRMRDEDEQFIDREMLRLERGEAYA